MKIVIDAGHGISTPGKRSPDGMREFEFNNPVAVELGRILSQYDAQVIFSHDRLGINDISLGQRVHTANGNKADLFISIHANAYGTTWNDANGIETFVYQKKHKEAHELAEVVQAKLVHSTKLKDRGVKEGDFQVLRATLMTAILVECGFMTNRSEAALLRSEAYRKKCAAAIADGIIEFYRLKLSKNPVEFDPEPGKKYRLITGTFSNKAEAQKAMAELQKIVKVVYLKEE